MERKFSVIKENLKSAQSAENLAGAIKKGQIEELAQLLNSENLSWDVVADTYTNVFGLPLLSENFFWFCSLLCNGNIALSRQKKEDTKTETVSYLDNRYSHRAIELLNNSFNLHSETESDFNSVCESVYSGRSLYGVIPLLNSRDGLIISLYKLLQKYDLKISASAKILMDDGDTETEFVLVSKKASSRVFSDDLRLMLSITHNYDSTVAEFLNSTASHNVILRSVNTLPLEYTDERCESVMIFDISACNVDAFNCFLHYALPEASIVGIYSIVK